MPYWIGIDEAGYGPNLGPLTISASVWQTADEQPDLDMYSLWSDAVTALPAAGDERLAIADSKLLYRPGGGLRLLERGLFSALAILGNVPTCWETLWTALNADPANARDELPWYRGYDRKLPIDLELAALESPLADLRHILGASQSQLCAIRSRAVFPREFNERTEHFGTKGGALSRTTLELLASVLEPLDDDTVYVVCDKHGGRNRYQELLQQVFPEHLVEVRREERAESVYRFGPPKKRVEVAFRRCGEGFLPAALASMACKYVREVCMGAFNEYWQEHLPGLRATAGYPLDAKRFRREIASLQKKLGIEDRILWRNR